MGYLKSLELKATRWVVDGSPAFYGVARTMRCLVDRLYISWATRRGKPFILIYQQGRVASTSVYESVCATNLPYPVYHVHTISTSRAEQRIDRAKKSNNQIDRNLIVGRLLGQAIAKLGNGTHHQPWKVICIFRDPISIIISLHFMHVEVSFGDLLGKNGHLDKHVAVDYFERLFDNDDPSGWGVCNWFDDVFFDETDVDVYSHPFDIDNGYTIINDSRYSILLLRFEDLAFAFKHGVAKLLNIEIGGLNLLHSNIHKDGRYDDVHEYVKKNLRLSRSVCEKVYSTKFVKHFYSSAAIEKLIRKWTRVL